MAPNIKAGFVLQKPAPYLRPVSRLGASQTGVVVEVFNVFGIAAAGASQGLIRPSNPEILVFVVDVVVAGAAVVTGPKN